MADARAWVAEHSAALVGVPVTRAAELVRDAGLLPRVLIPDAVVTLEYRPDRVTLAVDAQDVVQAVRPG